MASEERETRKFPEIYSEQVATAINHFLGIEQEGTLPFKNLPPRIDLKEFCRVVLPILEEHPADREIAVGWNLNEGQLRVTEVVEGITRSELQEEDFENEYERRFMLGSVEIGIHPLTFHSHIVEPTFSLPIGRKERVLATTPASCYGDLIFLVLDPQAYVDIIVDTNLKGENILGRVLVSFKTANSWRITEENFWHYGKKLFFGPFKSELTGTWRYHDFRVCRKPFMVGARPLAMIERLQQDELWSNYTGLGIYRGLLLTDPEKASFAVRWDLFYQRLMAMRKKIRGITNAKS